MAKKIVKYNEQPENDDFDEENFVRVPIDHGDNSESHREFKTYKIIKRLEY